jgi:hypothetical protein
MTSAYGYVQSCADSRSRRYEMDRPTGDLVKRALERIVDCVELVQVSKRQRGDQGRARKDEFGSHRVPNLGNRQSDI